MLEKQTGGDGNLGDKIEATVQQPPWPKGGGLLQEEEAREARPRSERTEM